MEKQKNSRRRGDDLLESLYDATIKLSSEVKHTNLTFQQIAEIAKTSRTVLYRRWATTFDLLEDVYSYKVKKLFDSNVFDKIENKGNLRDDLIELLIIHQSVYTEIGPEILNNFFYIKMQNKEKNKDLNVDTEYENKKFQTIKKILNNAKLRGEKIKEVNNITLMLPFDLIRIENMVRMDKIDKKRLEIIVDEILLPVFKG